jgi:hypothetical protein
MMWARLLHVNQLFIYSKCGEAEPDNIYGVNKIIFQDLPNVGREGHTWLTHMARKGVQFSQWNVFLQGSAETKLENIIQARLDLQQPPYNFVDLFQYTKGAKDNECYRHIYDKTCIGASKLTVCRFHEQYRKNNNDTCEAAQVSLRGEFMVSGGLLLDLDQEKIQKLADRLALSNNPLYGHFLERDWISVLGATNFDLLAPELRGSDITTA